MSKNGIRAILASVLLGLIGMLSHATARGGMAPEDRWAPEHIDGLPGEIRRTLVRHQTACGLPAAEHHFALYMKSRIARHKFIALHFEHFRCGERAALCNQAGCLHQVFVSSGGAYRLVLNVHVPDLELKLVNTSPAVEIACEHSASSCQRILYWNGARFVER